MVTVIVDENLTWKSPSYFGIKLNQLLYCIKIELLNDKALYAMVVLQLIHYIDVWGKACKVTFFEK